MKITYAENPLRTTVELDDHDREVFRLKIKVYQLQDRLCSTYIDLEEGQWFNLDSARRECDPAYYETDSEGKSHLDTEVDRMMTYLTKALTSTHSGDCTCVPMSCKKCHAESILGVKTLTPFIGKYELYKIDSAFSYKVGEEWKQRTLYEALEHLKNYTVSKVKPDNWTAFTQEQFESFIPRWEEEGRKAYEWLLNYQTIHFPWRRM